MCVCLNNFVLIKVRYIESVYFSMSVVMLIGNTMYTLPEVMFTNVILLFTVGNLIKYKFH